MVKFDTVTVKKRKFDVCLNSDGIFTAELGGEWVKAPTLRELTRKLGTEMHKELLNIKCVEIPHWSDEKKLTVKRLTITEVHDSGKYSAKDSQGHHQILNLRDTILVNLTPDQEAHLRSLYVAKVKSQESFDNFLTKYALPPVTR